MDVVSDAIAAVRAGRPSSNRLRVTGRWGARIPSYAGAGFHVVLAGGCWLLADGGEPLRLTVGDAVLLPHGSGHALSDGELTASRAARLPDLDALLGAHRRPAAAVDAAVDVGASGTADLLCGKYRLDHGLGHPLMRELPQVVHLPTRTGEHPELRAAVDLLSAELAAERPGGELAVPGLIDLLLVYLVRAWTTRRGADGWGAALTDPVVATALAAVHEDPAHPWTAETLAARAGVSRATLTRRFTALTGRPPMAYLTWWRMTRAAGLLRSTADPLEAVARKVGYASPYALSHAFARQFGTTPGRYRTTRAALVA
ncbi:AraC family transcriptional regulator [Kitasatospora xanthocidica]|uniref:AraC family transcriptional regulator n=1 Tax=Kitasatospora xanthocidica TaxID=83382 RepID=UPI00167AB2FF|nr:AraC family transcriptional regulator [Kitasatospora xanthocidica]GHF90260.1 AraC family transcriptional regulator [Kitasatospora xanthocidica]